MTRRRWFTFDGMEEVAFKRVPEGWVYREFSPWIVGPARHYLLDDARKELVVAKLRLQWPLAMLGIVIMVVLGIPLANHWFGEARGMALLVSAAVGLVLGAAFNVWLVHAVRPIVAGCETGEKLTYGEAVRNQATLYSSPFLIAMAAVFLLVCALMVTLALRSGNGWETTTIAGAIFSGVLTVYFLALFLLKPRTHGS